MNPGTIRCGHSHSHIYFPRDYQFFFSEVPISDAVMQGNRDAYRTINPSSRASSNPPEGSEAIDESDASPGSRQGVTTYSVGLARDAPKQLAA
jgi:hypothetical protein